MSFAPPRPVVARWRPAEGDGLEHATVAPEAEDIVLRGVVIGARGGTSYGVDYTIVCDAGWSVRALDLGTTGGMALSVRSDGGGRWVNHDGRPLPEFDGCVDVDLAGSPLTNTLAIRRLDWSRPGRSVRIDTLYVPFDSFVPIRDGQVYTCLEAGRRFRYQAADLSFSAEIEVDEDGLVLDYPGLFRRVEVTA